MNLPAFPHRVIRASAGSGKTHQLTNRYLALAAAGVEPESILATTFTRKAAGEILDRVLERLAKAAGDPEGTRRLAKELGLEDVKPSQATELLRTLISRLHRIRISTLDSFYIALAGSFSLELGLPAGWAIAENADDEALRSEALERLLDQAPDDIVKLFPLLSMGEMKRSVHGELRDVIARHHDIFLASPRAAWECLAVPPAIPAATTAAALEKLKQFNAGSFSDNRMANACTKDLTRFEEQDWKDFIGGGLAGKIAVGDPTYYRKPIPARATALYETLVKHARAELLRRLDDQTRATWQILQRFDRELRSVKQAAGQLRFGEVTQALVEGLERQSLATDSLAFRLDGALEHLLLDEFQDTALPQWLVLAPLAKRITTTAADKHRSFFCVGDVKQAIYGWRGGMAAILDTLRLHLGPLQDTPLVESYRSAQPIIDVVNKVFGSLGQLGLDEKMTDGLANWQDRFDPHTTVRNDIAGYVCLHAGPERPDDKTTDEQREPHYRYAAEKVAALVRVAPGRSIGVLCRTNAAVARIIYELRMLKIDASEEGGNPLTDSPAVEVILSLLSLADHPGHSVAWFHLQNSPLKDHLPAQKDPAEFSRQLRTDLLSQGYDRFVQSWAERLAPACNQRDLSRLQQLVEMAYAYQARSTLRADDFVALVRETRVPAPSTAPVRVMTIHSAKGLQFDAVVLPELDCALAGRVRSFVVGRDPKTLKVNFVCRYADEAVQNLLDEKQRDAFAQDRMQRIEESLSMLYVAMTRAIHALYLVVPGPYKGKYGGRTAWNHLLLQALAPQADPVACANIWQHGEPRWFKCDVRRATGEVEEEQSAHRTSHFANPTFASPRIEFRPIGTDRRRGLEHAAPSRQEGKSQVKLSELFNPSEGTGKSAGTIYHAWFEQIEWLDENQLADDVLRLIAERKRADLPAHDWPDIDRLLAVFRKWLQDAQVSSVLKRSAYSEPRQPGFPAALARFLTNNVRAQKVERERRFLVPEGNQFWNGSLDRVVWLGDGNRIVAADVLDYKTDAIAPGDENALASRVEYYEPQIKIYKRVVAKVAHLPEDHVSGRLIFTVAGRVVEI